LIAAYWRKDSVQLDEEEEIRLEADIPEKEQECIPAEVVHIESYIEMYLNELKEILRGRWINLMLERESYFFDRRVKFRFKN
jgi:hypothetical protein